MNDLGVEASKDMEDYFNAIKERSFIEFEIAKKARAKGYDPEDKVNWTDLRNCSANYWSRT
jgi:hypothetical protein